MPAWVLALWNAKLTQSIIEWVFLKLWRFVWGLISKTWSNYVQTKKDTKNGEQMREAIDQKLPREERDKRGTDLLNGD